MVTAAYRLLFGPASLSSLPGRTGASVEAVLFAHWSAIQKDNISASAFINYLQPLADLDGMSISHLNYDVAGVHHATEPSSRTTMSFALTKDGRVSIQSSLIER
jgi:hypothetical protein